MPSVFPKNVGKAFISVEDLTQL